MGQYNRFDYTMKVGIYMDTNEFDIDFDFEKEYGLEPSAEEPEVPVDDEFDLRSILNSDYAAEPGDAEDFDFSDYLSDMPEPEEVPSARYEEPQYDAPAYDVPQYEEPLPEEPVLPEEEPPVAPPPERKRQRRTEEPAPQRRERNPRRKPRSKMRQFKDDQLPLIIAGVAALLIVIFVFGAIGRAIGNGLDKAKNNQEASEALGDAAALEAQEAQRILNEAAVLAAGYDYQGAIDKLNTFTGDTSKYTDFTLRSSEYAQALTQLVAHNDPDEVANLSFHVLIADPSRAFTNQSMGGKYNQNFVTIDEFQKILEQLYANNYVLVEMDSFVDEIVGGDGAVTYSSKSLMLPDGKKPIMITETMVNYFNYMIDGNEDGTPDKNGAGFASRLVVENGEIKAEMVDANGNTVVGNYDLVPILEDFIKEHPDFSYRGARATLAITGHEGVFGYRTNASVVNSKGQSYYDEQAAGAREVVQALRDAGYEIACYTYSNADYGSDNASAIQEDIDKWAKEVVPIVGEVDTIVYARGTDIAAAGSYSGSKYNVLANAGFRYFIGSGNKATTDIYADYVRQNRLMVTGSQMYYSSTTFSAYFDSKAVLNSQRGDIPQA